MAGGVGNRVGAGIPKQFVEVLGKPVIAYTLQRLQQCSEIDHIVLSCVDGYQAILQKIADDNGISKVLKIVTGGRDYEHSIINGVKGLEGVAKDEDVVMIHWAASPFVSDEILKDNIRVCREKGNAMSACNAFVLYGQNNGDHADGILDRDTFKCLSAPQSFLYKNIVDFYRQVESQHLFDTVEAHTTSLMAALRWPIFFSKGDQTNIKITTKEDLLLFKGFVLAEQYDKQHHDE
jgi:2-C-methyl-D-erythritol 4-phosphate cytidylyltransferase